MTSSSANIPDPVALYLVACKTHGVKRPNPEVVKALQEYQEDPSEFETLDLTDNYVGNRGLLAIMDVIEKMPNFRYLNVSNQKLYNTDLSEDSVKGNAAIDRIVEVFKAHPSVNALDISNNPTSNYAGRKLLGLVQVNKRVCRVELKNTRIDFDLRNRIAKQCEKNTTALWEEEAHNETNNAFGGGGGDNGFGNFGGNHNNNSDDFGGGGGGSSSGGGGWTPSTAAADLTALGGGRVRRTTVRSEGVDPEKAKNFVPVVHEKSEEEYQLIMDLLSRNVLFGFMTTRDLRKVAGAMQRVVFSPGEEVMTQGTTNDKLYIIQKGQADILKEGQKVFLKTEGTAVGEIELMYDTPCVATVKVVASPTTSSSSSSSSNTNNSNSNGLVTWCLDRETYRNLVMGTAINRRETYMRHLEKIPFLQGLDNYEKMQIADALSTDEYQEGEYIIRYDKEGEWMFIILEGVVEVIGRDDEDKKKEKFVCDFTTGECIGELEFLNKHRTVADVRAKTYVQTAKLNRRHFEMCMGPVIDYLKRNSHMPKFEYYNQILERERVRPGSALNRSTSPTPSVSEGGPSAGDELTAQKEARRRASLTHPHPQKSAANSSSSTSLKKGSKNGGSAEVVEEIVPIDARDTVAEKASRSGEEL